MRYGLCLLVAVVTAARVIFAFRLPFDHDEAYYWIWAQHLALSYVDHPPMVAWLVRLGELFGQRPGWARLPFIVCEGVAALAVGATAARLAGNERAGAIATVSFLLFPQVGFQFGEVAPDAPFVCAWALALWCAAARRPLLCGLALGAALLSHAFGWALFVGLVGAGLFARPPWRRELGLVVLVALLVELPTLVSDALHGFPNLAFTLLGRHNLEGTFTQRFTDFYYARSVLFALIVLVVLWAVGRRPGRALVVWTAAPLTVLLLGLAFVDNVLPHWFLGPFTSLCVGIGVSLATRPAVVRWGWCGLVALSGAVSIAVVGFFALPVRQQVELRGRFPSLRDELRPDPSFADARLAHDLAALARPVHARIVTDYYDVAAALTYYGVDAIVAGGIENRPGDVLRRLRRDDVPQRVLYVAPGTLAETIPTSRCSAAYAEVSSGPLLVYRYAGIPIAFYDTLWCARPREDARGALYATP